MTKRVLVLLLVVAVTATIGHAWAGTSWPTSVLVAACIAASTLVGAGLSRGRGGRGR